MSNFLMFLIIFCSSGALAQGLIPFNVLKAEDLHLELIKSAVSSQNLLNNSIQLIKFKNTQTLCRYQLQKNKVPYGCYLYIDYLIKHKRIGEFEEKEIIKYLDSKCIRSAKSLFSLKKLKLALKSQIRAKICLKALRAQKKIAIYKLK